MSGPKSIIPLKPLDFEGTARAVEKFSRNHNIPSLTFPAGTPPQQEEKGAPLAPETRPRTRKRLPMEVPEYVMDSLKRKAAETKGASVRFVVLSALKAYGIEIDEAELVKDKRRNG